MRFHWTEMGFYQIEWDLIEMEAFFLSNSIYFQLVKRYFVEC